MLKIFAEHREHIAKIHRQYSWDVRGCCSDKEEGIILLKFYLFKEKTNQQVMVKLYEHSEIHIG